MTLKEDLLSVLRVIPISNKTIKKREVPFYAIWLSPIRNVQGFDRNLQSQRHGRNFPTKGFSWSFPVFPPIDYQ